MKMKSLRMIVLGSLMALAASPVFAGQWMEIRIGSPSGCYNAIDKGAHETGTQEFRDKMNQVLGKLETIRDTCPDSHMTMTPTTEPLF